MPAVGNCGRPPGTHGQYKAARAARKD